MKETIIRRN